MNIEDIPKLQAALQAAHPTAGIQVHQIDRHRLRLQYGEDRTTLLTPNTMDFTALDWREWLHRAEAVLREKGL